MIKKTKQELEYENKLDFWFIHLSLQEKTFIIALYTGYILAKSVWEVLEESIPQLKKTKI
jgi:hypothetical protein